MLQSGAIYQFSFAYDVLDARKPTPEEQEKGVGFVLTKLEVFEISVVTVPANQKAEVTEVKSAEPETKQGKRNRKADEEVIRNCIESLKSLLDEGEADKPDEDTEGSEKAATEVNAKAEEQTVPGNSQKAAELLESIKKLTGGSDT